MAAFMLNMMIIIPKCPLCKTEKYVIIKIAEVKKEMIWFNITYCKKCFTVIECDFRGKLLKNETS